MAIKVNVDEVAQGNMGVYVAINAVISSLGEAVISFFLDIVPERGEKLWVRFRDFQEEKGQELGFSDFIQAHITAHPMKPFFPKECNLDPETRQFLVAMIKEQVMPDHIKTNADLIQIYFGEGPAYEASRQISCQGCPQQKCRHNLSLRRRRK